MLSRALMNRWQSLGCLLSLVGSAALAQERKVFTLDEAVAYAMAHQPRLRAAAQAVEVRRRQVAAAKAPWAPEIRAGVEVLAGTVNQTSASFFNLRGVDIARIAGRSSVRYPEWQPYPSTFAGIGVRQEVFDFGRIGAQASAADAQVDVAREASAAVAFDVRYSVEEAFVAVLAAKAIVRASDEAYARSKAHRELAAAGVKSGLRPPIELTRAEAELDRTDASRIRAQGALEQARVAFAATVGDAELAVDADDRSVPPSLELPASTDEGVRQAFDRNPRWREALAEHRAFELETQALRAEYRPELYAQGVLFGYAGGIPPNNDPTAIGAGWLPSVPNYAVSLLVNVPVFDYPLLTRARVAEAREGTSAARVAETKEALGSAVRSAYVAHEVAKAALPSLERAVKAANDNWAQADARFRAGLGTSVELADADALRQDAEIQLALGQFNLARAAFAVKRVIAQEEKRTQP